VAPVSFVLPASLVGVTVMLYAYVVPWIIP
jgi:hypothetical protein